LVKEAEEVTKVAEEVRVAEVEAEGGKVDTEVTATVAVTLVGRDNGKPRSRQGLAGKVGRRACPDTYVGER